MRIVIIFLLIFLSLNNYAQKRPKVGLVLSGGGAKGVAHIGVIRELEKKGIKPDYIVGTSMGALIGGLYAAGFNPDQLQQIIVEGEWDYLMNDEIRRENYLIGQGDKNKNSVISLPLDGFTPTMKSGLYEGQNVLTLIEILVRKYNRPINFDSLEIPFRCIGTNIETGEAKVFSSGKLADAMRASMSIPSVFSPYEIDGELYVDGGLVNNFPTDVVKAMGADIIIGVDVGATLYKKEEINSIIQILDQSASFYNARISKINAKLCDVYIRPDIKGLSAMDFSSATSIINRGVVAFNKVESKVDSIFHQYKLKEILHKDSIIDHNINVDTIILSIDGYRKKNKRAVYMLIRGKLGFETPCSISDKDLGSSINRLYGSRFFSKITTEFVQKDSSYILKIKVKEKVDDEFNFGVRYDDYYNISLMLGVNLRNKLIYGSLLEIRAVIGGAPQIKLRYTTDRGSAFGMGTSLTFDNFYVYSYSEDYEQYKFNYNSIVWDWFIHRYFNNYNRAIFGIEASMYGLSEAQSIADFSNFYTNYGRVFGAFIHDTWDRSYFPNRGVRSKGRADLFVDDGGVLNATAWARVNSIISLSRRVKLELGAFVGYGSPDIDKTLFRYMVGGMENSRIQWYNSQPGLRYLEKGGANIWQLSLAPRFELFTNNFITYKVSVVALSPFFEELFVPKSVYSGMALEYGYNSMFGPITFSADYSLSEERLGWFMSFGYWF